MELRFERDLDFIGKHHVRPSRQELLKNEPIVGKGDELCVLQMLSCKPFIGAPWVEHHSGFWLINGRKIFESVLI